MNLGIGSLWPHKHGSESCVLLYQLDFAAQQTFPNLAVTFIIIYYLLIIY